MGNWLSFKGLMPFIVVMLVGVVIVYFGGRKPKGRPKNEEKKNQNN